MKKIFLIFLFLIIAIGAVYGGIIIYNKSKCELVLYDSNTSNSNDTGNLDGYWSDNTTHLKINGKNCQAFYSLNIADVEKYLKDKSLVYDVGQGEYSVKELNVECTIIDNERISFENAEMKLRLDEYPIGTRITFRYLVGIQKENGGTRSTDYVFMQKIEN